MILDFTPTKLQLAGIQFQLKKVNIDRAKEKLPPYTAKELVLDQLLVLLDKWSKDLDSDEISSLQTKWESLTDAQKAAIKATAGLS